MDRHFRTRAVEGNRASPQSASWLFAQALLGKPVPSPSRERSEARIKREQLEWLAQISTEHERALRRLQIAEADAGRERERLEWLASISTRHERQFRRLLATEAEAREALAHCERFVENLEVQEAQWDPAKHPHRGGPPNAGWWATTGGSGGGGGSGAGTPNKLTASSAPTGATTPPATKPQLPAAHRGTWVSGTLGHGVFRYNDSIENKKAGLAGKEVRFENQHIAVGGLPADTYYGDHAGAATVEIDAVTGTRADNLAADAAMRKKLGDPKWQRPTGYLWNHAGTPGSTTMELVKEGVHEAVAHKGPAAEPRAIRRAAGNRGTTGKAMGTLTVYLTARDALQAGGILQPDYEVADRESYHYVSEDGSVFVVWPAGWFSSAKREFVAGPRKGQTETITDEEIGEHRKQAEEEWGKYIPGTLLSEPRFIPGKKRTSLPLIEYRRGIPYEAGWIDARGVHRYPVPKAAVT